MFNIIQRVVDKELQLGNDTQLLPYTGTQFKTHLLLIVIDVLHNLFSTFAGKYTQVGTTDTQIGTDAASTHTYQYASHGTGLTLEDIAQFFLNES